jgi:hypothetical protein
MVSENIVVEITGRDREKFLVSPVKPDLRKNFVQKLMTPACPLALYHFGF